MKIKYDKIADAIYIAFNKKKVVKSVKFSEEMIVDVDRTGAIIGIEFIDASKFNSATKTLEESVVGGIPVEIFSKTPVVA